MTIDRDALAICKAYSRELETGKWDGFLRKSPDTSKVGIELTNFIYSDSQPHWQSEDFNQAVSWNALDMGTNDDSH